MSDGAVVAARLVHFAAITGLFGLSFFPLYAGANAAGRRLGLWLVALAVLSLASAWGWLMAATAAMAGALSLDAITTVIADMSFGRVWAIRLVLGILLIGATSTRRPRFGLVCALSATSLAAIAMTGHAQAQSGVAGAIHQLTDSAHLLAAGVWLGGLIGLALMLRPPDWTPEAVAARSEAVLAFSRIAVVGVAALVLSGLVNAVFLVGSPQQLLTTDYGRLLSLKIGLFLVMLGLAAFNRQVLTPSLPQDQGPATRRLARHVLAEQVLGLGVLLVVAVIGQTQPPAMAG